MLYLCDDWFERDGSGHTAQYPHEEGRDLRLRFYSDQLWSPYADENKALHRLVLPVWWVETSLNAAGEPTSTWASTGLWRHWRYALDPGTMVFHCRRLASAFCKAESIPALWFNPTPNNTPPTNQTESVTWRAQIKSFKIISGNARKRWLKAVSVVLLCGFNHQKGSTDVTSIIVKLLDEWQQRDTSHRFTNARYFLDEAVEDALYGVSVSYAPKRSKLC